MSLAFPHLAEPYSTPCLNFLAFLALKYTTRRSATPPAIPISKSFGKKLGGGLENKSFSPFMAAIILSEALLPGDTRHSHAILSQKYPARIYGRFIRMSFFLSTLPVLAFSVSGMAFKSLAIPSIILLITTAPCLFGVPLLFPCSCPFQAAP